MILADTSIWVDHFRQADAQLRQLISNADILLHPYVLGELTLGGLPDRNSSVFGDLTALEEPPVASTKELLAFIAWARLANTGIGFVDAHLLVSARLLAGARVLTRDKRLATQAARLGLGYRL